MNIVANPSMVGNASSDVSGCVYNILEKQHITTRTCWNPPDLGRFRIVSPCNLYSGPVGIGGGVRKPGNFPDRGLDAMHASHV